MTRTLVVEDEPKIARALREGLQAEGFDVAVEHSGESAFFRLSVEHFDLALLDLGLPGRQGLDVLRTLRAKGVSTPVIVLTARDSMHDRVSVLDAGADDYLAKPFAFAELLARMRAVLRRSMPVPQPVLVVGALTLDVTTRRVAWGAHPLDLTVREFDLLQYLMRCAGQIVSRDSLARDVWMERSRSTPLDNVIDVHIARLRRKFEAAGHASPIQTIRGVGFMLQISDVVA